ncbi:301_t:CDS:2, partial [Rhizophagus irregularis]
SKIPRKKGRYVSQDQVIIEDIVTEEIEAVKNEKWMENNIIEEWIESEEWLDDEIIGWTGEELKKFDKVGKRLITEALHWHKDADHNIRAVYTGNSRTTVWRKGKEKQKLENETKGMKTLDTFFKKIIKSPLFSVDNLHIRLKEINQQCIISKSAKDNEKIFTYNYLRCLSIRRFIQLLLDGEGELLVYRQGKHTKLESLVDDEDFKEECLIWKSMKDFDGDMLDVVLEPQLKPGEKELVQVTHHECHFYANDGQQKIWIREDEDILRSKHIGRLIMVSAFLLSNEQLQANPHIGNKEAFVLRFIQTDGYWKSEHMLDQLVHQAIPIFELLHPGCIGVFCFDQSTNHNAMAADALIASKMNLSPGGAQPKMRDGWYINEHDERCAQSMIFPNNHKLKGQQKGIKQVLKERNLWPTKGIRLMCEQCSGKHDDINPERIDCCA